MENKFNGKVGEKMFRDADFIISIRRTLADRHNSKIKIIKNKFTPSKEK